MGTTPKTADTPEAQADIWEYFRQKNVLTHMMFNLPGRVADTRWDDYRDGSHTFVKCEFGLRWKNSEIQLMVRWDTSFHRHIVQKGAWPWTRVTSIEGESNPKI